MRSLARQFTAHVASAPDGACHVRLVGEFDFANRQVAEDVFDGVGGAEKIVLDLSELDFIDSMGIHFVVMAHERAKREGRTLTIVRGGPQVTRVFSLVGLDDVLPFADVA